MITVIITTCKRPPCVVSQAVKSVMAQTYTDWELLVVDDSPADYEYRDAVRAEIETIPDDRVHYLTRDSNYGACSARNFGARNAHGEYLCYLDDDDIYLPDKLAIQLKTLSDHPDCGWCQGNFLVHDLDKDSTSEVNRAWHEGYVYEKLIAHEGKYSPTITPLVKKEVFDAVGGFDENMPAAQDFDLWLRISKISKVCTAPGLMFIENIKNDNRITRSPQNKLRANERIIEKNEEYLTGHPEVKAYYVHQQVKYLTWLGRRDEAKKLLGEAAGLDPKKALRYRLHALYWRLTYGRKKPQ